MTDPRQITLQELLSHPDRNVREQAQDILKYLELLKRHEEEKNRFAEHRERVAGVMS